MRFPFISVTYMYMYTYIQYPVHVQVHNYACLEMLLGEQNKFFSEDARYTSWNLFYTERLTSHQDVACNATVYAQCTYVHCTTCTCRSIKLGPDPDKIVIKLNLHPPNAPFKK